MADDILSGGTIDRSTSGPIPSNLDGRDANLIEQQSAKQRQDAIGGTEFAPRPQPPPQIPEPVEIAPPLPDVPSLSFDVTRAGEDFSREAARQAVMDVLKNVTINGQGPTIEGSSILFDIGKNAPSASESFLFDPSVAEPQQGFTNFLQAPSQAEQTEQANLLRNEFNKPPLPDIPQHEMPQIPPPPPLQRMGSSESGQDIAKPKPPEQPQVPPEQPEKPPEAQRQDESDKEATRSEIRDKSRELGGQSVQKSWSNFIDPQTIKSAIEESEGRTKQIEDAAKTLEPQMTDDQKQEIQDYADGNTPFPPLISFQTCYNGAARYFLIPAFGPYQ